MPFTVMNKKSETEVKEMPTDSRYSSTNLASRHSSTTHSFPEIVKTKSLPHENECKEFGSHEKTKCASALCHSSSIAAAEKAKAQTMVSTTDSETAPHITRSHSFPSQVASSEHCHAQYSRTEILSPAQSCIDCSQSKETLEENIPTTRSEILQVTKSDKKVHAELYSLQKFSSSLTSGTVNHQRAPHNRKYVRITPPNSTKNILLARMYRFEPVI